MIVTDIALARRLERTEATANANFVEARARLDPARGSCWIEVAGAYAMFDGADSPCTQSFGLGVFETPTGAHMAELERFFHSRGAPAFHDVSPLAGIATIQLLHARGYRPIEMAATLYLPLDTPRPPAPNVRIISPQESETWVRTAAEGWREQFPPEVLAPFFRISTQVESGLCFLAEIDGQPAAAGSLHISNNTAILGGASTIPEFRNRGAQRALLETRLHHAAQMGCDLAMMCAEPGSASQRNAERQGFRIAYTRTKWQLDPA